MRFFDPEALTQVRRGKLPHWTQPDVTYFVTFRLADSLPATKVSALREERDLWLRNHPVPLSEADRQEFHQRFTGRFEYWLDQGYGECWLARQELKSIVETALMYFHGDRYRLGGSIVMPNHVHALVTPGRVLDFSLDSAELEVVQRQANQQGIKSKWEYLGPGKL